MQQPLRTQTRLQAARSALSALIRGSPRRETVCNRTRDGSLAWYPSLRPAESKGGQCPDEGPLRPTGGFCWIAGRGQSLAVQSDAKKREDSKVPAILGRLIIVDHAGQLHVPPVPATFQGHDGGCTSAWTSTTPAGYAGQTALLGSGVASHYPHTAVKCTHYMLSFPHCWKLLAVSKWHKDVPRPQRHYATVDGGGMERVVETSWGSCWHILERWVVLTKSSLNYSVVQNTGVYF